ncbi:MAG: phosphoadenosine phosphosulfate reductase family protein [Crocinitomicaceae bacterium]|nr:phosphoadenosine phosphosulfate reductase family protein [Crocinitomicaceae bacterium]
MSKEVIKPKNEDLTELNAQLKNRSPQEIVEWAIDVANQPVVTTNFRPYEASILHAVVAVKPDIHVIWCDTGYNTPQTYKCADKIIQQLNLNIDLYVPKQSTAWRDVHMGIPSVDDEAHGEFTRQVKLEPFERAMAEHQPDVWFTNLRKGQTALRDNLDILSFGRGGVLKVSPFYHWSDEELDNYMAEHNLPNEFKYYDPTKALENRECGLHLPAE